MDEFDRVVKNLTKICEGGDIEVRVGWFDDARYNDGTPVAAIANIHEYGAPAAGIPPRPFLRPTSDAEGEEWLKNTERAINAAVNGNGELKSLLGGVGQKIAGDIRATIARGNFTELSATTLRLRKMVDDGLDRSKINKGLVAKAAQEAEDGEELSGRTHPLTDTGYMIATLTSKVNSK